MDVTIRFASNIPDEQETRRVRTSAGSLKTVAYGIADTVDKTGQLAMLDLFRPDFRGRSEEAVFAIFGRVDSSKGSARINRFLADHFIAEFSNQLGTFSDADIDVNDALRRTFLKMNKRLYDHLLAPSAARRKSSIASAYSDHPRNQQVHDLRKGADGTVVFLRGRTLYVANLGSSMAVISR
jgi:adenylate cyclase